MIPAFCLAASLSFCGQQPLPSWAVSSQFDSVYEQGQLTYTAKVTIQNGVGVYVLSNGAIGYLLNIYYSDAMMHPQPKPAATPAIFGNWVLNGQSGVFVFRNPDRNGFVDGYWGYDFQTIAGSWDSIQQKVSQPDLALPPLPADLPKTSLIGIPPGTKIEAPQSVAVDLGLPIKTIGDLPSGESFYAKAESPNANTIIAAEWIRVGLDKRAPSVGQIVTSNGTGVGTCFMVAPGVAFTAKHIFDHHGINQDYQVRFPIPGGPRFDYFKLSSIPLLLSPDIAVLELASESSAAWRPSIPLPRIKSPEGTFFTTTSLPTPNITAKGAPVIHYPLNMGQQISISGRFTTIRKNGFEYNSDTDNGSSGAPVFSFDWQLVAIHFGPHPNVESKVNVGYRVDYVLAEIRRQLDGDPRRTALLEKLGLK